MRARMDPQQEAVDGQASIHFMPAYFRLQTELDPLVELIAHALADEETSKIQHMCQVAHH